MLSKKVQNKLESLRDLPTIPAVMSQVLAALDNPDISAANLAKIIENDQSLTAKVLKVANSPFYGFARKISTIDLAVVVMGINTIKEIILSLIIQKFFNKIQKSSFDVNSFWQYSVFCGTSSRVIARKLGYRLAGEAFVTGLMHDIGVLVLVESFSKDFLKIRELQEQNMLSMPEAEMLVLETTHAEIGAWIAEKWNLPDRLCVAIAHHHTYFMDIVEEKLASGTASEHKSNDDTAFGAIDEPLTAIVSMSEWFAKQMGYMSWAQDQKQSPLYLSNEIFDGEDNTDFLDKNSAFTILKQELTDEFEKASVFKSFSNKSIA